LSVSIDWIQSSRIELNYCLLFVSVAYFPENVNTLSIDPSDQTSNSAIIEGQE